MTCIIRAAALALSATCLMASIGPASAQDAATIKELRAKSMIKIDYKAPDNDPKLQPVYERLQKAQVLERLQAYLAPLRLPHPITVRAQACGGQTELPYQSGGPAIICYEYVALVEKVAPAPLFGTVGAALVTRQIALVGPVVELVLRNTARAVLDTLDIPVWGNIEDGADSLSAFLMLASGQDVAEKTIFGTAYFFSQTATNFGIADLAGVRPLVQQRYYNLLCIAVGENPVRYSMFIALNRAETAGDLPKDRVADCVSLGRPQHNEFNKIGYAFQQLILKQYVDPKLLSEVRSIAWLKDD
jgi:hypothetical protein